MTIETKIAELIAQAEPLRALPDLEAEAKGLGDIVNRINALRAEQSSQPAVTAPAAVEGADALQTLTEIDAQIGEVAPPARKKPGRKPKAAE